MFCIRPGTTKRRMITAKGIGSIESTMIPQNAGCTMAIHADCTTAKTSRFYKLLIYKDF